MPTRLEIGQTIADQCQRQLGDGFRVVTNKEFPLQWDIFAKECPNTRAGGFAFDEYWFRLDSYCKASHGYVIPKPYRDRVNQIVLGAIREVTKNQGVAA